MNDPLSQAPHLDVLQKMTANQDTLLNAPTPSECAGIFDCCEGSINTPNPSGCAGVSDCCEGSIKGGIMAGSLITGCLPATIGGTVDYMCCTKDHDCMTILGGAGILPGAAAGAGIGFAASCLLSPFAFFGGSPCKPVNEKWTEVTKELCPCCCTDSNSTKKTSTPTASRL